LTQGESQMRALGATPCTAHPKVRNIAKQLEEHNIISIHELQIARRMGIVAISPVGRAGSNDGLLFPYELSTIGPASPPVSPETALAPVEPKRPEKLGGSAHQCAFPLNP
jgi:hypothetical protein